MIVCRPLREDITVIANELLDDERLSPGAIGFAAHLAAHGEPGLWERDLCSRARSTPKATRTAVGELERFGYLIRRPQGDGEPASDLLSLRPDRQPAGGGRP